MALPELRCGIDTDFAVRVVDRDCHTLDYHPILTVVLPKAGCERASGTRHARGSSSWQSLRPQYRR